MGELRGLGDLLDHLVERLPEGLVVVDERGAIVFANPRAETMFGYAPGGLNGVRVEVLVPEGQRSQHTGHRVGFIAHPHARPMTANLNLQGRKRDGSTFPVDIFLGPTRTQEGVFVLAVVRDITHRWLLERELRGDLAQVRKLAETVPEVLWVTSPDGSVIHYVNQAYEAVWGQPRERLYSDPFAWLESVHEEDREAANQALLVRREGALSLPFRVVRPGGEIRWLEARALPIEGDDGRLDRVARIIEDVTERKRLEELLLLTRERLEAEVQERTASLRLDNDRLRTEAAEQLRLGNWLWEIFESLPDGTAVVNPSGDIVGVNKTLCDLMGYERGELLGRGIDLLIPSLHRSAHHRHVADFFQRPRRRPMASGADLEAVRKDGRTLAVDIALSPLQAGTGSFVVASVREIAQRRRDEHVSRENQERLELAMRGLDAAVWDWDLRTGKIYFSPRWKSLIGYEDHEVPNDFDEWRSRLHPADLERAMSSVRAHLDADSPRYELVYRLRHRDGTYRWMLTRGMTLHDSSGRQARMVGANLDVTECRRYVPAMLDRSSVSGFQRSIEPSPPPELPGLLAGGRLFPSEPGAGDFYDFLTLADGSVAAVLADVAGRGRLRPHRGDLPHLPAQPGRVPPRPRRW
ncbi:MAG: PAS domain S-box protein [Isosphaeraceae bacterium]